ncbi:uncharacterized protein LOC134677201 [Cydia fagiglandana]|uniref:uncharacterized protein LOC134677201 n=1 Tax=Cydia fagiglandana TaxID=1458189 RepID=UPI002FEE316A
MSFDVNWDVESQREDHECEEHWQLRKAFIERWKNEYPKDRLVCLARVFANMEFMGCRYPTDVMQEVARLSQEVASTYRKSKKGKLQRTFVSASDAAEDRARGVKREGGIIKDGPAPKSSKIQFVKQGQGGNEEESEDKDVDSRIRNLISSSISSKPTEEARKPLGDLNEYLRDLGSVRCLDARAFDESMFFSSFGQLVLLVRPWAGKWWNIQTSCQVCNIPFSSTFEDGAMSMLVNGLVVARASGASKADAKCNVEVMAWNILREEVITVVVKEQFRADGGAISVSEVAGRRDEEFGAPVENSVATKMMKLMGWAGGGLGAAAQGIEEPIKPHLQMVNRQGLGSTCSDAQSLRRAAFTLMRRYLASDCLDVDLIFSKDFSKEERASLHQVAQKVGLASRSYGAGEERFLVVKKKLDPFSLARAVLEKGGNTPKYQVFIPCGASKRTQRNGRY